MPPDPAPPSSVRFMRAGVLALVLFIFAVIVAAVTIGLRANLREQILQREAESIATAVSLQLDNEVADLSPNIPVADVPGVLLSAVLKTTQGLRVSGHPDGTGERARVTGVRVFNSEAKLNGYYPFPWSDEPPSAEQWARLKQGESVGHLHARASAEEIIDLPRSSTSPA